MNLHQWVFPWNQRIRFLNQSRRAVSFAVLLNEKRSLSLGCDRLFFQTSIRLHLLERHGNRGTSKRRFEFQRRFSFVEIVTRSTG